MRTHQPAVQQTTQAPLIMRKACNCGRSMSPSGECLACRHKRLGIQTKLRVNKPGDRYEQEADRVSAMVLDMAEPVTKPVRVSPFHSSDAQRQVQEEDEVEETIIQRQKVGTTGVAPSDSVVTRLQSSGSGKPLASHIRGYFEPRFGYDFSQVRVHTDTQADAASRSLSARAFTVGSDIAFGTAEYAPETSTGKQLLAHELTHVIQQTKGSPNSHGSPGTMSIQRQTQSSETSDKSFKKKVHRILLMADEYMIVIEHEDGSVATVAAEVSGDPAVGQARIRVDPTTGQLAPGPSGLEVTWSAKWIYPKTSTLVGVDQIIFEVIDPSIVKLILGGTGRLETYDDPALVSVLDKMKQHDLSEGELYDLRKKGGRSARNWKELENTLDEYLSERTQNIAAREETQFQLSTLSNKLTDSPAPEELYKLYRNYRLYRIFRGFYDDYLEKYEADFTAKLQQAGFEGIDDYEQTLQGFQKAFEDETRALAYEALSNFDRILEQEQKNFAALSYTDPENPLVIRLIETLDPIREGARESYERADTLRDEADALEAAAIQAQSNPILHEVQSGIQTFLTEESVQTPQEMLLEANQKRQEAKVIKEQTEVKVVEWGKALLPVINWQDFPRRKLVENIIESDVRYVINYYLASRRGAIRRTRNRLEDDPMLIYHLDTLMAASRERQRISDESVLGMIIADKQREETDESWLDEVIQIIALALTFLGGPIGIAATVVAAGTSTYQAIDEVQKFDIARDAYQAQLSSQDPSSVQAWLAIVGAVLDIGDVVKVIDNAGSLAKTLDDVPVATGARSESAERSLQQLETAAPHSGPIKIDTLGGKRTVGIKNGQFTMCRNPCASLIEKLQAVSAALPKGSPERAAIDTLLKKVTISQETFRAGIITKEAAHSRLERHLDELEGIQAASDDIDALVSMDLDVLRAQRDNLQETIATSSSIDPDNAGGVLRRARPTPGVSERDAHQFLERSFPTGDWEQQVVFLDRQRLPPLGPQEIPPLHSTVPESYSPSLGVAAEVKDWDLSERFEEMIKNIKHQQGGRHMSLPPDTKQWLFVDVRQQGLRAYAELAARIKRDLGGEVLFERLYLITEQGILRF